MSSTLTRLYGDHERATAAVASLKKRGFKDTQIDVFGDKEGSRDGLVAAIVKAGVREPVAKQYLQELSGGRALVVVRVPFGHASEAIFLLDKAGPVASQVTERDRFETEDSDFLFSAMLGLPLLTKDDKSSTKLLEFKSSVKVGDSTFSGLMEGTISSRLGIPEIIKK